MISIRPVSDLRNKKNFTIYYVVIPKGKEKKIMEVRRILHNLQNREKNI